MTGIASEAVLGEPTAMRLFAGVLSESTVVPLEDVAGDAGDPEGLRGYRDAAAVVRLLTEASIRITPSVLEEFEQLIAEEKTERYYQKFLEAHPVLLDPLAAEMVAQQRLGVEYATDFALRRHDGGWTLVEIERPQDGLFTRGDDFAARFTHAFGQVLDFQQWVDQNVAYARELMPGIAAPRGLLVIGTRQGLGDRQAKKLKQFADNSRRIEIVTYDQLLARGRQLYASLWHRTPSS